MNLREAGEKLAKVPPERRRREIARLAASWLRPANLKKASAALSKDNGYPAAMSLEILRNLFSKFDVRGAAAAGRLAAKLHAKSDRTAGLIFPSNVPDPVVVNLFLSMAAGCAARVRFSDRSPAFGRLFVRSLASSPVFRGSVQVAGTKEKFFARIDELDSVIAFGSDETMGLVQSRLKSEVKFLRYGHALSAGILFADGLKGRKLDALAKSAARDAWLYDQRGCFSPQIYFTEGRSDEFAEKLHAELARLEKDHGRVKRPYPLAVERRVLIDRLRVMALDSSRLRFLGDIQGEPVVYELKKDGFTLAATGQIVAVKNFSRSAEIVEALGPVKNYIRCLAIAGTKKQEAGLLHLFDSSKLKRICKIGQMQNPPISAVV